VGWASLNERPATVRFRPRAFCSGRATVARHRRSEDAWARAQRAARGSRRVREHERDRRRRGSEMCWNRSRGRPGTPGRYARDDAPSGKLRPALAATPRTALFDHRIQTMPLGSGGRDSLGAPSTGRNAPRPAAFSAPRAGTVWARFTRRADYLFDPRVKRARTVAQLGRARSAATFALVRARRSAFATRRGGRAGYLFDPRVKRARTVPQLGRGRSAATFALVLARPSAFATRRGGRAGYKFDPARQRALARDRSATSAPLSRAPLVVAARRELPFRYAGG
jgi:hypothetical protein